MEKEGLFTTVVGSFPLDNTKENMIKAFEEQVNMGIDYPCYPQLVPMIDQFLDPLSERISSLNKSNNGDYILSGEFDIPHEPFALEYGRFMVDFFNERPYLKSMVKGTRACLTGPFTLASEILLNERLSKRVKPMIFKQPKAIGLEWVVDNLATIMKKIGKAYSDIGVNIISMDEPILGLIIGKKSYLHSEDYIIEKLNEAISGIDDLSSIHVCGRVSPKLRDILLQTDIDIMDHEFRNNEKNFEIFRKEHIEDVNKYLAMGVLKTNISPKDNAEVKDYVEDIDFLRKFIQRGIDQYGKENLLIKPDCGFGSLKEVFGEERAYTIVIKKLNNMVLAVNSLKG
ncbi:MAG: uroporphyrinogen decarboxylase family protein [Promethearchaeia archaeon]